ncbi:MAG: pantetheine-phosphate adenylyltransferase [Eubacteriales bacterium]|nr:pantetheine-phosphate adenylyltransferase [Eubacteriales bacterium]
MVTAIYPGSFDPVTNGHLDIIERASKLTDRLIIGVLKNNAKTPLFSLDERVNMLKKVTGHLENVSVQSFEGLTVDFARETGASAIVRGLRAVTDFEYELQLAQTNRVLAPDIDTIFLTTNLKYSYLSSSIVKEIAGYGGEISEFLCPEVAELVQEKIDERRRK